MTRYRWNVNKRPASTDHSRVERRHGSDPYNNAFATSRPASSTPVAPQDETVRVMALRPESHSASDLSLQIAALRVELERVLAELGNLRRRGLDPGDVHAARMRVQVRDASRSLEEAVAHLMPLEDDPTR
jgi:hypothetical protein